MAHRVLGSPQMFSSLLLRQNWKQKHPWPWGHSGWRQPGTSRARSTSIGLVSGWPSPEGPCGRGRESEGKKTFCYVLVHRCHYFKNPEPKAKSLYERIMNSREHKRDIKVYVKWLVRIRCMQNLAPMYRCMRNDVMIWKLASYISLFTWSRRNCLLIVTPSAIDCDVISRMKTERVRHGDKVSRSSFLSSFMDSFCRVRNRIMYVHWRRTVSALTRVLFWCLFPLLLRNCGNKHQITFSWAPKQFITRVHTVFSIFFIDVSVCVYHVARCQCLTI